MGRGWIKLHRNMLDWEWYEDVSTTRVFIHLLLTANHKDKKWKGEVIKRGSLVTSIRHLAEDTRLSTPTIQKCLKKLIKTGEIRKRSTNKYTIIEVVNYSKYQADDDRNR